MASFKTEQERIDSLTMSIHVSAGSWASAHIRWAPKLCGLLLWAGHGDLLRPQQKPTEVIPPEALVPRSHLCRHTYAADHLTYWWPSGAVQQPLGRGLPSFSLIFTSSHQLPLPS